MTEPRASASAREYATGEAFLSGAIGQGLVGVVIILVVGVTQTGWARAGQLRAVVGRAAGSPRGTA